MEICNVTGKTKTGELRVTKAIGALVVSSSVGISSMSNEKISVKIQRPNSSDYQIFNKIPLKHFILGATYGDAKILPNQDLELDLSAVCELAEDGAIPLAAGERIIIELTDLKPASQYVLDGLEYPQFATSTAFGEKKTMLNDENERSYNVYGYDLCVLNGLSLVEKITMSFSNGESVEYTRRELMAISNDVEGVVGYESGGSAILDIGDTIVFPLQEVHEMEIEKKDGTVEFTLYKI